MTWLAQIVPNPDTCAISLARGGAIFGDGSPADRKTNVLPARIAAHFASDGGPER
jgi:hypothetical protein